MNSLVEIMHKVWRNFKFEIYTILLGISSKTYLKLPGAIQPKFEKYCHPAIFDQNPIECMQQGIMGDFFLAIDEKKTLVCPVTTVETSTARNKKHAMVMYHFDDENFIFNTSNPFQAMEFKVSILNL